MDDTEKLKSLVTLIGSHGNYSCNGNIDKASLSHRQLAKFNKFRRFSVYALQSASEERLIQVPSMN